MKIAFTSCMRVEDFREQPVWDQIAGESPDYLFLLGDQIYMDYWPNLREPAEWDDARFESTMRERYEAQWAEPHFKALVSHLRQRQDQGGGVYGTWDDHDFAWNNACGKHEVPESKQSISRRLFREFMQCAPANRMFYSIPLMHAGATIGKAIFLDTRSYRDEPGENSDLLGEEQFEFLRKEIEHPHSLTLICAGTPMRAKGKGCCQYLRDFKRIMEIIGQRKAIFLSGDIHDNAFLPPSTDTRLFEIIASGAAVMKAVAFGKRRNYGLLDWTPERTIVKLLDKRGIELWEINNDTYTAIEHEPK